MIKISDLKKKIKFSIYRSKLFINKRSNILKEELWLIELSYFTVGSLSRAR